MSKSWGWCLEPFTDADRTYYEAQRSSDFIAKYPTYLRHWLCRKKGCGAHPEVFVRYSYVTGRAGRVSWQQKPYCRIHGEQIVAAKRQPEAA